MRSTRRWKPLPIGDPDRVWTVREIAEFVGIGGMGAIVVGSPKSVADQLESWIARDRHRRIQPGLRGYAGELYGFRRVDRAGTAAARSL